jgi:hypothetical protein
VENITSYSAASLTAAAFPGASSAWISDAGCGVSPARTQRTVLTARPPHADVAAFWALPAQPVMLAPVPVNAALSAVNRTRKQNHVHSTRINAGGYGAMGPHPEREPA